jgi:hypothetical protein
VRVVSAALGNVTIANPRLDEAIGGWTLMALFERDGQTVAAFEQLSWQDGSIAFVAVDNLLAEAED